MFHHHIHLENKKSSKCTVSFNYNTKIYLESFFDLPSGKLEKKGFEMQSTYVLVSNNIEGFAIQKLTFESFFDVSSSNSSRK